MIINETFLDWRGEVELFYRFPDHDQLIYRSHNMIVYSASDLMAQAIAGNKYINGMYFAFANAEVVLEPVPVQRMARYYHTINSTPPRGFTRVALAGEPLFTSNDITKYNGNQVTFTAVSDNDVVIEAAGNTVINNVTRFFGAGLMHLDAAGYANDILFSAVNFEDGGGPEYLLKLPGAQIGFRWIITFGEGAEGSSSSESSS